jgi:hypothetical protein
LGSRGWRSSSLDAGSSNRKFDPGEILSILSLNPADPSTLVGVAGRDRLAMFPVNSAAGLILPDEGLASHGNSDIESVLDFDVAPAVVAPSSVVLDFEMLTPQNISVVGVVAPKAAVEVTAGGEGFPANRGRCGQEADGESFGKEDRARLLVEDGAGAGDDCCLLFCRFSRFDDDKLFENMRWMR